jgi:ATP-dependent RNA helicase DDX3X
MAEALIKILLECGQEIPDFLADQKPAEGQPLVFDDDSDADDDEEEGTCEGGDAWGDGGNASNGDGDGGDAWGSVNPVAATPVADNNTWDAGNDKGGW